MDVSVVMPCQDEAQSLADCILKAQRSLATRKLTGEVIVVDAGSTDGSQRIALEGGARVIAIPTTRQSAATRIGIEAAAGRFIVTARADGSYDFSDTSKFVQALENGADLVVGNRYAGGIEPGAMAFSDRYFAIPGLNLLGRILFRAPLRDFHCGMLAITKDALDRLGGGVSENNFASALVARGSLLRLRIAETATTFTAPPRLRELRASGQREERARWQQLRFLLLRSPKWLFLYPGLALIATGCLLAALESGAAAWALGCLLVGFNACVLSAHARVITGSSGLIPRSGRFEKGLGYLSLKRGLFTGTLLAFAGIVLLLLPGRATFASAAALLLAVEIILASFFLSILRLSRDPA